MYLGRFQLGGTVPLRLRCESNTHVPTVPDDPPIVHVFNGSGTKVLSARMPVDERYVMTGSFRYQLFLGSLHSVGHYTVVYYYSLSSAMKAKSDSFEIVAGGDTNGAVTAAYFYQRPEANYVIQGLEDGTLIKRRNPTV